MDYEFDITPAIYGLDWVWSEKMHPCPTLHSYLGNVPPRLYHWTRGGGFPLTGHVNVAWFPTETVRLCSITRALGGAARPINTPTFHSSTPALVAQRKATGINNDDKNKSPNSTWLVTSRLDTTRHLRRVERVKPCCSTSSTQSCMGSTRRTCRVMSRRDEPSGIWSKASKRRHNIR